MSGDTRLNAARREREINALVDGQEVDLLVIGLGITGAGVALDAATAGYASLPSMRTTWPSALRDGAPSSPMVGCATSHTVRSGLRGRVPWSATC